MYNTGQETIMPNCATVRERFSDAVDAARHGERIRITKHNKPVAALVSIDDLQLLEKLEDELDILDAERILKDIQEGKEKVIKIRGSALDFLRKLN